MLALGPRPQRRGLVDRLPIRRGDLRLLLVVPGLLGHRMGSEMWSEYLAMIDLLSTGQATEELVLAVAQVQDDVGAAARACRRVSTSKSPAPCSDPAHALVRPATRRGATATVMRSATMKLNRSRPELADQVGVLLLVALEPAQELARAALGDRAQVRHRLLERHADAVVADRQRLRVLVEQHAHLEVGRIPVKARCCSAPRSAACRRRRRRWRSARAGRSPCSSTANG